MDINIQSLLQSLKFIWDSLSIFGHSFERTLELYILAKKDYTDTNTILAVILADFNHIEVPSKFHYPVILKEHNIEHDINKISSLIDDKSSCIWETIFYYETSPHYISYLYREYKSHLMPIVSDNFPVMNKEELTKFISSLDTPLSLLEPSFTECLCGRLFKLALLYNFKEHIDYIYNIVSNPKKLEIILYH